MIKLRLSKCTQYKKDAIMWQVSPLEKDSDFPAKFYFVISYHKEGNQYLRFTKERPSGTWDAAGAFSSLFRKHLPNAILSEIFLDTEKNTVWIPLFSSGKQWILHIHHEGAVEISLLSPEGVSLVRLGSKGIFTKKKDFEDMMSLDSFTNRIGEYLQFLNSSYRETMRPLDYARGDGSGARSDEENTDKNNSRNENNSISQFQKDARRKIARRLKTVRMSYEKLLKDNPSDESIAELEDQARTLQSQIYTEKNTSHTREDLEKIYTRLKKIKKGRKTLSEQLIKTETELRSLEFENQRLQNTPVSEEELLKILGRFRISIEQNQNTQKENKSLPYRVFKSEEAYEMLLGKGPKENDELTKSARANDYWFHAIGLGGSHVIVPSQKLPKTGLTEKIKREASILALHHSRVRKDLAGEVYITQRRHLSKKKGMPPGLWLVQQSETFYITYTEEELKKVLSLGV